MRVDEEFMNEVGLAEMPAAHKEAFMEQAEEELEVRVGQNIGALLSDAQIAEFEQISDVEQAAGWLNVHVPNYREIVAQVFQGFKKELLAERDKILG